MAFEKFAKLVMFLPVKLLRYLSGELTWLFSTSAESFLQRKIGAHMVIGPYPKVAI